MFVLTTCETELIRSKQGIFKLFSNMSNAHAFVVLQAIREHQVLIFKPVQSISNKPHLMRIFISIRNSFVSAK